MLRPMSDDLGWSRTSLSLAATSFMIVSALALPIFGRLIDRYSIRWTFAVAALIAAVSLGLTGLVQVQWQLIVLYGIIYAVGNAGTSIAPVGVMISRWFERGRGMATSVAVSGNAAGQLVIITALASALTLVSWRTSYAILGIVNLVIVVPLVLLFVRSRPGQTLAEKTEAERLPSMPILSMNSILTSRQFWLLLAIYAICGFQDFFVAIHVVAFALDQGVGPVLAGNMLALMGLLGLLGVLSSGALSDMFGAARPTIICFLMRIFVFGFIIYFQSTPAIMVFALLYAFTFLITAPLTVIFASNMFGMPRLGTVSGLITMVHQIASGLGAFVGAAIFDGFGSYDNAFILMFALAILATGLTLFLRVRPITSPSLQLDKG